jgi:S1-C subfamily serine protease
MERRGFVAGPADFFTSPASFPFTAMNSQRLSRVGLPLLAFCAAFVATASLTVWAAESRTPSGKPGKGSKAKGSAPAEVAAGNLRLKVDERPINRDAADRISYAPVVKRTSASVVYVYSSKTVRGQDMSRFFNDPLLRRFFNLPDQLEPEEDESPRGRNRGRNAPRSTPRNRTPDQTQQGLGSGVVISADGYIITNNHVVDDADDVRVSIGDSNKRYEAKVVGRDPGSDLAVLKIEATGLSPATFGDSDQLQVGDVVLAIGNPFGVGQSVSRGIVSALGRGMGMGVFEDFIQTDAAINPGNSGGALLDTDGRVVGINSAIVSRSGAFAGVGFAIPANLARSIAEQLANTGKVERGFLGVRPQELTEDLTAQFGTEGCARHRGDRRAAARGQGEDHQGQAGAARRGGAGPRGKRRRSGQGRRRAQRRGRRRHHPRAAQRAADSRASPRRADHEHRAGFAGRKAGVARGGRHSGARPQAGGERRPGREAQRADQGPQGPRACLARGPHALPGDRRVEVIRARPGCRGRRRFGHRGNGQFPATLPHGPSSPPGQV